MNQAVRRAAGLLACVATAVMLTSIYQRYERQEAPRNTTSIVIFDQGSYTAEKDEDPWALPGWDWGLDHLELRQYQSREGWVLIHGVWATDPQFLGPEDEPQPRSPVHLASLLSHALVPYGKLRLEKALGFLSSPRPGCCRRVRASILPAPHQ